MIPAFLRSRHTSLAVASTIVLLLSGGVWAQQEETDGKDPEPFRVDVNLVTLRFTVKDQEGRFQNSLTREDFKVEEDGQPVEIIRFEQPSNRSARNRDLWLAFLIDVSGSTFATRTEEIVAAQTFLDNLSQATRIGVFGFNTQLLTFQTFTPDRRLVLSAISQAREHLGQTAIYRSLEELMDVMAAVPAESPKAIILVSDGLDPAFARAAASSQRASEERFSIYTIRVPSSAQVYIGPDPASQDVAERMARDQKEKRQIEAFGLLARNTGGIDFSGFETILDFDNTLADINDDLFGNLYRVGYYTEATSGAGLADRIRVTTLQPGLRVASAFKKLPLYFDSKRSLLQVFFDTSGESSLENLALHRFHEIGADMDLLSQSPEGKLIGVPFRIKVNPYSFRGAQVEGVQTQLGVLGLLLDHSGQEIVRLREIIRVSMDAREVRDGRGILYSNRLLAPPGAYRLEVVLLELSSWRLTSFSRRVTIRGG